MKRFLLVVADSSTSGGSQLVGHFQSAFILLIANLMFDGRRFVKVRVVFGYPFVKAENSRRFMHIINYDEI